MSEDVKSWTALAIFILLLCGFGYVLANQDRYLPQVPTPIAAPEQKPATKTRCDITGFMASSIIAEEKANGYRFDGRVSTLLCGNGGLSFSLERQDL